MRQRETEEKGTTREDKEDIGSVGGKTEGEGVGVWPDTNLMITHYSNIRVRGINGISFNI